MSRLERVDNWLTKGKPSWMPGLSVALGVMVVGGVLVVLVPEMLAGWLDPPASYPPGPRTDWIDSVRTGFLGVIAFGAVVAWVTEYRQAISARTVDEYTQRVRQLSQGPWEQVAAIRDLEGLADTNPELRIGTLQMLAVFVRDQAPRTQALYEVSTGELNKRKSAGKRRPKPGVQEALRVISCHLAEWSPQPHTTKEDLVEADEDASGGELGAHEAASHDRDIPAQGNYVSMADIAIDGALLRRAQLNGINLRRSVMRDVKLEHADLSGARLRDAVLSFADLESAILVGTSLNGAKLNWADLRGADLRGAVLRKADVSGADLRNANLRGAVLRKANLSGAHLAGAVGLSNQPGQTVGTPHCMPDDLECTR